MRAEGEKGERKKKRKEKEKGFFISPCACFFFHIRSGHFSNI